VIIPAALFLFFSYSELEGAEWVATTADFWSVHHKAHHGKTVHWLDSVMRERKQAVLGCYRLTGQHTSDFLAQAMTNVHFEFHIQGKVLQ
jgi:hypothetical protein